MNEAEGVSVAAVPVGNRIVAGRYRLVARLGAGAMGTVWRAFDSVLDTEAALKEIEFAGGVADAERADRVERALREARHAAKLRGHPHVVTILDVVLENGLPWIVMELVPSRSLFEVIRDDGPLPVPEVARIGVAMLDALVAARTHGIVHRDVKPSNVLIGTDGRVVLTDFGIATGDGDPTLTVTGVLGTPLYMAPERLNNHPANFEADLFSLGGTLFFAVEGRPPFERDSFGAMLAAIMLQPPAPAPHAGALGPVLAGLLEKDPDRRMTAARARDLLERATDARSATGAGAAIPRVDGLAWQPRPAGPDRLAGPGSGPVGPASPATHRIPPVSLTRSEQGVAAGSAGGPQPGSGRRAGDRAAVNGTSPSLSAAPEAPGTAGGRTSADGRYVDPNGNGDPNGYADPKDYVDPDAPTTLARPSDAAVGPGAAHPQAKADATADASADCASRDGDDANANDANDGRPAAPADLTATDQDGAVLLRWEPSATAGAAYRVSRVLADPSAPDGRRERSLGITSRTELFDAGVPKGVPYWHEVVATVTGESGPLRSAPVRTPTRTLAPPVTALRASMSDDAVALSWRPIPGHDDVLIERTFAESSPLSGAKRRFRGSGGYFLDPETAPSAVYRYRVWVAVSDASDALAPVGAAEVMVRIVPRPRAVLDLESRSTLGGAVLRWTTVPGAVVRVYATELPEQAGLAGTGPFGPPDHEVGAGSLEGRARLVGESRRGRLVDRDAAGTVVYTPVTIAEDRAVIGQAVTHTCG